MAKIVKEMMKKPTSPGAWAFLVGVILAVVLGLASSMLSINAQIVIYALLVLIGLVVGLMNVTSKESQGFLLAGVSLVLASHFGGESLVYLKDLPLGEVLLNTMNALTVLFASTTIVVALKAVFAMARD